MNLAPTSHDDPRLDAAVTWARSTLGINDLNPSPVAGDASFRRYFRLADKSRSWILMDAPPDREDSTPFVDIARRLAQAGVHSPAIIASDLEQGYLLLEDFGDILIRDVLDTQNADFWFTPLFDVLEGFTAVDTAGLPAYDRNKLLEELELFTTWYLQKHKDIQLSCEDWDVWEELCTLLIRSAQAQPQIFVHRDFHSCNLLQLDGEDEEAGIGVIDFQDGVHGPLTYDLASLLWDRYIRWPRSRLEAWMDQFRDRVAPDSDPVEWRRACDWMGLQRNLKIVGIFARLHYRDGKPGYLEMIPQFWGYVRDVLGQYPEFNSFDELLEKLPCEP